jgi:hypothetical protein
LVSNGGVVGLQGFDFALKVFRPGFLVGDLLLFIL